MKTKSLFIGLATLSLALSSCVKDESDMLPNPNQREVYTAIIEDIAEGTRATATDAGVFSWTDGDPLSMIAVNLEAGRYTVVDDPVKIAVSDGKGTFTLPEGYTNPTYAGYPLIFTGADATGAIDKISLPSEYGDFETPYTASTNSPMFAEFPTSGDTDQLYFRHLAGVVRVRINNVPAGVRSFVFTSAATEPVTGPFAIDLKEESPEVSFSDASGDTANGNGSTITYDFQTTTAEQNMTFYVPVPVGTYSGFTIELKGETSIVMSKTAGQSNTVERGTLLLMPEIYARGGQEGYEVTTTGGVKTYTVYTAAGLQAVNRIVAGDPADGYATAEMNANIILGNDIVLPAPAEGGSNWIPLGAITENNAFIYEGVFDGNNHKISGLTLNEVLNLDNEQPDYNYASGLIRYMGNGSIENLTLENCDIAVVSKVKSSSENFANVAGFVGFNEKGAIKNCKITGRSSISHTTRAINPDPDFMEIYTGGFVAYNLDVDQTVLGEDAGSIQDCAITGTFNISTVNNADALGGVAIFTGGIVAFNGTSVLRCSNSAECNISNMNNGSFDADNNILSMNAGGVAGSNYYAGKIIESSVSGSCNISNMNQSSSPVYNLESYAGGITGEFVNADPDFAGVINCSVTGACNISNESAVTDSDLHNVASGGIVGAIMYHGLQYGRNAVVGCYAKEVNFVDKQGSGAYIGGIIGYCYTDYGSGSNKEITEDEAIANVSNYAYRCSISSTPDGTKSDINKLSYGENNVGNYKEITDLLETLDKKSEDYRYLKGIIEDYFNTYTPYSAPDTFWYLDYELPKVSGGEPVTWSGVAAILNESLECVYSAVPYNYVWNPNAVPGSDNMFNPL